MSGFQRGSATPDAHAAWRRPRTEAPGLERYVQTLRERYKLVLITTAFTLLAAILYLATADKVYEAEADLLVTPVSDSDQLLTGLGLIRESNDPTRDVETAARLVTSRDVAERVKLRFNLDDRAENVASKVEAAPVAQSNIVAITARENSPRLARDLANGFAEGVIADRSAALREQVVPLIERTRARVRSGESADVQGASGSLSDQLATLERLRVNGDPTIRLETRAVEPDGTVAPRPLLTLIAALMAGLVLGVGGAFAAQALDPRLRREEQLRELYSLPILARIPNERHVPTSKPGGRRLGFGPRRRHRTALGPSSLSPRTLEAYRTLRTMLTATADDDAPQGRAILLTGPSPSEGKTTSAINLASSYALAGKRVILIESDFRRPTVGEALGVRARVGVGKVLLGNVSLEDALVPVKPFGEMLRVLPVERANDFLIELLSLPAARNLLGDARRLADYVIVDSPPLTEVVDALPLTRYVDDVLLVCRLGSSNLGQLSRLGDLLEQNDIQPSGFVLVGVGSSDEESYYLSSRRERPDEFVGGAGMDDAAGTGARRRRPLAEI